MDQVKDYRSDSGFMAEIYAETTSKTENGLADPPMLVRATGTGGFIRTNASFRAETGYSSRELAEMPFLDWIDPADHPLVQDTLRNGKGQCSIRHRTRHGEALPLDIQVVNHGEGTVVLARRADVPNPTEPVKNQKNEATVSGTLEMIAKIVEEQNPGYKCSILLVADGRFVKGAGPSLPDDYNAAIDGYAVGPTVGSCGTAIFWNAPVIVDDIQADPLWTPFAELAKKAGVAACWSHPFTSTNGRVLGALALYSPEPRSPTKEQLGRLKAAARMTGLAVERGRAEEALVEQRKRELELEEQLRQAAKMEALGVLAGGVAHDFNNILATILANAELAKVLSPPESEVATMLKDIITASQRAGQFCQQMLAYAGRGSVKSSKFELSELISELSGLVLAALSKKTSLEYSLHDKPIFLEGDENQLLQVIMNLVTNAAEAIGDDNGQIVVSSKVVHHGEDSLRSLAPQDTLPPGDYVHLAVSDSGSGMDAETIARIFDPFFTTKFTGRGLGLSAVQGIVNKHRGVIQVSSKLGQGTTFTVILPIAGGTEQRKSASSVSTTDASNKCVLVVDDDLALRTILCKLLKHSGFDVLEAADGQQAIDTFVAQKNEIDCVLLDVSMPKLSGEEVFQQLRTIQQQVPIVMMSGYNEGEIVGRVKGAKPNGALQKPISAEQLITTLNKVTA